MKPNMNQTKSRKREPVVIPENGLIDIPSVIWIEPDSEFAHLLARLDQEGHEIHR